LYHAQSEKAWLVVSCMIVNQVKYWGVELIFGNPVAFAKYTALFGAPDQLAAVVEAIVPVSSSGPVTLAASVRNAFGWNG
jgi:hypothetical protein